MRIRIYHPDCRYTCEFYYEVYENSQAVLRTASAPVENWKYETNAMRIARALSVNSTWCLSVVQLLEYVHYARGGNSFRDLLDWTFKVSLKIRSECCCSNDSVHILVGAHQQALSNRAKSASLRVAEFTISTNALTFPDVTFDASYMHFHSGSSTHESMQE